MAGTYIAYSASAGEVAADGDGANSPFAASLVAHLPVPGADLDALFNAVRTEVYAETERRQTPESRNKVVGPSFYFNPGDTGDTQVEEPAYEPEVTVLEPDPGSIVVTVVHGGVVELDGVRQESVKPYGGLELSGVSPGRHVVSVGGEEQVVQVKPGGRVSVELQGEAPNPAGIEWVSIPGGSFQMGSNDGADDEKPVHTVRVSGFEMSRSEVTVGQYRACVDAGSCSEPDTGGYKDACNWGKSGREDHPINCVDWEQASTFARWAGGRLPSESEWEYAVRGGQSYTYAGSSTAGDVAWYKDNSGGRTHEVCGKRQNGYGLCDMSGNVWEWVEDWYHDSYSGAPTDGSSWTSGGGSRRVYRGGSGYASATNVRVANRFRDPPSNRLCSIGFRLTR